MDGFPWIQAVAFAIGCLVILLIRRQFPRTRTIEVIAILILYAILVVLFTEPVVRAIKGYVD